MFKFLHTADVHLDSPLLNLDNYDSAPREEFRSATRRAFDNVVDLAINEEVHFVLIAGDLYDGDCSDFNTPLHFRRRMEELAANDIRVFIIQGNHDAANNMRKAFALTLPDNVHLFSTKQPETVVLDEPGVAIHGQGFAEREVTEDLSQNYPTPDSGLINIGMLHTNCGSRAGHDPYAPSTVDGLNAVGYDYWALGHIHKAWDIGPGPWIVYPGNPQGRHIREDGPRGCVIATCDGKHIERRSHTTDVVRWSRVEVRLSASEEDIDDAILVAQQSVARAVDAAEDRPLAIRIDLTGATGAHRSITTQQRLWDQSLREAVLDNFDEQVWVEKIRFRTRPQAERSITSDSSLTELIDEVSVPEIADFACRESAADIEKMLSSLPQDQRTPAVTFDENDSQGMSQLLSEARELVVGRLLDAGGDE